MKIDKQYISDFIDQAIKEDVGDGDHTSLACIDADSKNKAKLLVKDDGVIAGVELAEMIFKKLDPDTIFETIIKDGEDIKFGDIAFYVTCHSRALLMGERLALNLMQRMSGIATLSSRFATEVEGTKAKILDTRKTTPLLRLLEKWAVKIGGCYNYRVGLYDRIMIKDNHVEACGGIGKAVKRVQQYLIDKNKDLKITVEVRNLLELEKVIEIGGVERIMLDNFELPILNEAVNIIDGSFQTEASGGVNLHTVRKIAETGVDYISVGALTHSAGSLDLSLKIVD